MTDEIKGAETGGNEANGGATAEKKQEGGDSVNLLAELEKLKKELSTRDSKITEFSKKLKLEEEERKAKELASKTAEEKLAIYEQENKLFKQREAFRATFKEEGLDPEVWQNIINASDYNEQAKLIKDAMAGLKAQSSEKALETFKSEQLAKIEKGSPPAKSETNTMTAFERGLQMGLK